MPPFPQLLGLFPPRSATVGLEGLYLGLGLHRLGSPAAPFVYANFVSSLDGRIALEDAGGKTYLPKRLTSPNDFRLFLELHAQADCLVTHGGYLRALAAGRLGNILQVGAHEAGHDLPAWREAQGLPPQPAVVVASASLDFPLPPSLRAHGQTCYIATGAKADPAKVAYWRDQGYEVLVAGPGKAVAGGALTRQLGGLGYRTPYLVAGPRMLETMVRDGCLSRLFLTTTHQLLGGLGFHGLLPGPELGEAGRLRLISLYYDAEMPADAGQCFAQFAPGAIL
ncbi:RibD family protein [Methylomagnum ishizawai]|uniref:RibD family protein n=1 Tax=Methylomagnum ishizawai TaxID=1760988 RepID=UPI001C81AEF4|nr:dihydrofolate reductase family protein [Methylomagnum ishizawai]